MNILVLGVSGMIGNNMFRVLSESQIYNVCGTVRDKSNLRYFEPSLVDRVFSGINAENPDEIMFIFDKFKPDVVINCIGVTKHKQRSNDALVSVPINTIFPHRLAGICKLISARLIHISSDCVFSGLKGNYVEQDLPDAYDVYGKSKALGEIIYPNTITLRTSTLGHELQSKYGLLEWFLSQLGNCEGYRRVVFSGLPTVVFSQLVRDEVIPRQELIGLYHVSSQPINKLKLLEMIADEYGKIINIRPDEKLVIDRSLDSSRFHRATGYIAPEWSEMIKLMHSFK